MRPIVTVFAVAAAALCAACASGRVLDDYLAGWQSQRDSSTATFVHRNFVFQRDPKAEWAAGSAKAAESSDALEWAAYARPTLAAATRSRAIFIDRGRAEVLDRFLAHMRADPGAEATTQWFTAEESGLRDAAQQAGARAGAVVAESAGPLRIGEQWSQRIVELAAEQGSLRGRALALSELRRTAALYYRDIGFDRDTLGFVAPARSTAGSAEMSGDLVEQVDTQAGWSMIGNALIAPYRCERSGGEVSCVRTGSVFAPDPRSAKVSPDDGSMDRPIEGPIMPGDGARRIPTTGPSPINDRNQQYGW